MGKNLPEIAGKIAVLDEILPEIRAVLEVSLPELRTESTAFLTLIRPAEFRRAQDISTSLIEGFVNSSDARTSLQLSTRAI
jgi:hypothetical protein